MNAPTFNYSRIVDLSRPLDTGPDQHPWVRYETEIESIVSDPESAPPEGRWYVVTTLRLGGHAGTHVEAPLHAVENGASVGEVPVERFFGEAVVLDLTEVPWGRPLEPEVVREAAAKAGGIRRGDILFLHFDWDRRQAAERGHPFPSNEALEWLVAPDVKLVGIDSSGLEVAGRRDLPNHHTLFGRGIPLIESLANLGELRSSRVYVMAIQLPALKTDAIPLRVLAFEA